MPSNWSMIDNNFPTFTDTQRAADKIESLKNYMYLLVEQLKYQLNNLDSTNWNTKALQAMQSDTTKDVEQEISNVAGDLTQTAEALADIVKKITGIQTSLSYLERTLGEHGQKLSELDTAVQAVQADVGNLCAVVQTDGSGGATIGSEEKEIRLVGKIYINGVLMEGGTT